jgi:hypothetical protein
MENDYCENRLIYNPLNQFANGHFNEDKKKPENLFAKPGFVF